MDFFYLEKNISDFLKSIICIQIDEYGFYAETIIESERALSVKKDKSNGWEAFSFNPTENIK